MSSNTRNTRMIVALVVAMTLGAGLLLQLESRMPRAPWDEASPLMARQETAVESMTISTIRDRESMRGADADLGEFDAAILPSGECYWREAASGAVRVALLASGEGMNTEQARTLLLVIRSLHNLRGLDLSHIRLEPEAGDAAAAAAHRDVRALLARKGLIR